MAAEIAQPASRWHDHRHANHVDDEHPLDLIEIGADTGHDLRDGDVDNRRIERKQKGPHHNRPGHPPFIGRTVGQTVLCGAGVGDLAARSATMPSPFEPSWCAHPTIAGAEEWRFFGQVDRTLPPVFCLSTAGF